MLEQKIIILDTETISLAKPFIYDLGGKVATLNNKKYETLQEKQHIITEIYDNAALFQTAYYASKRPRYSLLIRDRVATRASIHKVMEYYKQVIKTHNIKEVYAYNAGFDKKAVEFTTAFFDIENPFANLEWVDIHAIAGHYIHNTKEYSKFALANELYTSKGFLKTSVESTYAFLINDINYIEPHTALQDVEVEMEILNAAILQGFDNAKTYKKVFLESEATQTLTIERNGKVYNFKYKKQIVRRDGTIVLS